MTRNRWKLVATPVALLGLASPMMLNCGALPIPAAVGDLADAASGCDEFDNGGIASLKIQGGATVEGKVKGFLSAAADLKKLTTDVEIGLIASCGQLGADLGMDKASLEAKPEGGEGAKKVCEAVSAKVSAMLGANGSAKLEVSVDPPKCYADIDFMTSCFSECGSPIQGGELSASCEGGEISGKCDAECKGLCTVEAGAQCAGTCKASCSGKCDAGFKGTCGGKCDGKCDGKNTKGTCNGTCEGKCDAKAEGTCSGSCDGTCSGSCEMKGAAKCEGSCTGGCSADIQAPKCSGEFKPPKVDPTCQMNCAAKGMSHMTCDPPNVRIVANGKADTELKTVMAALQKSLPAILKVQLGMGDKAIAQAQALGEGAADLKDVATEAGAKALVCIGTAGSAAVQASASLKVNVSASASVGGSVKGGT